MDNNNYLLFINFAFMYASLFFPPDLIEGIRTQEGIITHCYLFAHLK